MVGLRKDYLYWEFTKKKKVKQDKTHKNLSQTKSINPHLAAQKSKFIHSWKHTSTKIRSLEILRKWKMVGLSKDHLYWKLTKDAGTCELLVFWML